MLKLYHFTQSPYGWMARMALAEKGLAYEGVQPHDKKDNPELSRLNPWNKTPTLICDDKAVFESMAVLEFLDERYPDPPLMPKDLFERARVRAALASVYIDLIPEVAKIGRSVLDFAAWDLKGGGPPPMRAADKIDVKTRDEGIAGSTKVLGNFATLMGDGPFLAGAFSLADIALTPFVANLPLRGYQLPAELSGIAGWYERIRTRPSFAASKPAYI